MVSSDRNFVYDYVSVITCLRSSSQVYRRQVQPSSTLLTARGSSALHLPLLHEDALEKPHMFAGEIS